MGLGDITHGTGCQNEQSGGISIYGEKFATENLYLQHYGSGWVSMDNWGFDSNKSSFFITLGETEFMNDIHVVFGKVIKGMNTARLIEEQDTYPRGKADQLIRIFLNYLIYTPQ